LTTWPTNYRKVTGSYGEPRSGNRIHSGVDIRNPKGGIVYTSDTGIVIKVWNSGRGGNQILIQHGDGTVSGYAHTAATVKQGQLVFEGQPIGYSDDSGAGPPHLHYTFKPCKGCLVSYDPYEHIKNANMPEAVCR
jgi:murein DD-endopeptidase MepM/ murein hydrolase activator NlpD